MEMRILFRNLKRRLSIVVVDRTAKHVHYDLREEHRKSHMSWEHQVCDKESVQNGRSALQLFPEHEALSFFLKSDLVDRI